MESLADQIVNWGGSGYGGYGGLLKGDNSQQEMQAAQQQQALQNSMAQQQWNTVSPAIREIIANGGLAPGVESAMNSQAINGLPQAFRSNLGSLNDALVARGITGGTNAGGGQIARNFGQLGAMEDYMKSNALQNVQLAKQQNLNAALGLGSNLFGTANQGAQSALGTATTAANNADQAQTAFWGSLLGAVGSIGGAAAGKI